MYREWKEIKLCSFGDVQRVGGNRIPKRVLFMKSETTRERGRPLNRGQNGEREDGRRVGGKEWHDKVYNREEWNTFLRTARNCRNLHMAME
jgi:hypothetical protein